MIKELFIDQNLKLRLEDTALVITQGSSYISLAMGFMGLVVSAIIVFFCLGTSQWAGLFLVFLPMLFSIIVFGLKKQIRIEELEKKVETKYTFYTKWIFALRTYTYLENIFLIQEEETSENTVRKLFLKGTAPIFLLKFNANTTAKNFQTYIEKDTTAFMIEEL